jgi:hypothetical protein
LPNHRGYGELKNQGSIPVHQSLLADVFGWGVPNSAGALEHGPDPIRSGTDSNSVNFERGMWGMGQTLQKERQNWPTLYSSNMYRKT